MLTRTAREIHCHICGGFIGDPGTVSYRVPRGNAVAAPHSGMCDCHPPTVYGAPPGSTSTPGIPAAARPRG